ncbi:MAG: carboxypeptidase-like regulatory domain-containing protein [bacterium]
MNLQLLQSPLNLNASIILKDVPSRLFLAGDFDDESDIVWQPAVPCILKYSKTPGNRHPANYPNVLNATGTGQLRLNPASEGMDTGIYYCILVSELDPTDTSVEFKVIVQANVTPVMKSPLGRINLQGGAPLFRWDPVEGVPYYSLFLSEGPIALERDEAGKITGITGLNLTWQAVTPATFMKYGDLDPGGNFANIHVPPLFPGIEYNWVVLNSYGPGPDLISSGVAPVAPSSFEVTRALLSQPPTLTEPAADQVISDDEIVFQWLPVPGVARYKFYLYESADLSGSAVEFVVWSQVTSDTKIRFDAKSRLVRTDYQWRVVAEAKDGISTSKRRPFTYEGQAGWAKFIVNSEEGPLSRATIEIKTPSEASILLPAVTDTFGVVKLPLPTGDYTFRASRPGFVTTAKASFAVPLDDTLEIQTLLNRGSSSVSGKSLTNPGRRFLTPRSN